MPEHYFLQGLADPKMVGSSEYHDIYDMLVDADYELGDMREDAQHAVFICKSYAEYATDAADLITKNAGLPLADVMLILTGHEAATVHAALQLFRATYPASGNLSLADEYRQFDMDVESENPEPLFEPLGDDEITSLLSKIAGKIKLPPQ